MKVNPFYSGLTIAGAVLLLALGYSFFSQPVRKISNPEPKTAPSDPYTFGTASRDGIGKFYLGREISQVMGHQGIDWLERANRADQEAPNEAIAALDIPYDAVIADIGAGSGYYTFRLAPLVPKGKVVAIDIQPEMIAYLQEEKKRREMSNVTTHLSAVDDLKLPVDSLGMSLESLKQ
jgi:hypothetical protein